MSIDIGHFEFRLAEADQDRYEHGHEWFVFDAQALYDSTATELSKLEKAMGGTRISKMLVALQEGGADGLRAACYIARRQAGVREAWAAFDPRVLGIEPREPEAPEDDVDPPESSSTGPEPSSTADGQPTSPSESDPA